MSLNFDLTEVRARLGDERYEEVTTSPDTRDKPEGEQKWHPVTDFLIWHTMFVDLGTITEANVDEWCFRLGLLRCVNDRSDIVGGVGKFNLNRNDIVDHIGLRTNATTRKRSQWLARVFGSNGWLAEDAVKIGGMLPTQEPSAARRINKAVAEYKMKLTDPEADVVE